MESEKSIQSKEHKNGGLLLTAIFLVSFPPLVL